MNPSVYEIHPSFAPGWFTGLPKDTLKPRWFYDSHLSEDDPGAVFQAWLLPEIRSASGWVFSTLRGRAMQQGFPHFEPARYAWSDAVSLDVVSLADSPPPLGPTRYGGPDARAFLEWAAQYAVSSSPEAPTPTPPALWSPERPKRLGPCWVFDMNRPLGQDTKPFEGFVAKRSPADPGLTLRTIDGHLLRPDEARYVWHPWQEATPDLPTEAKEPPQGVWSHRPWRSGVHRVVSAGTSTRVDLIVLESVLDWRVWSVFHAKFSLGRTAGEIMDGLGDDALWFRYPDPPEPSTLPSPTQD